MNSFITQRRGNSYRHTLMDDDDDVEDDDELLMLNMDRRVKTTQATALEQPEKLQLTPLKPRLKLKGKTNNVLPVDQHSEGDEASAIIQRAQRFVC